jgi:hypothetical protein
MFLRVVRNRLRQHGQKSQDKFRANGKNSKMIQRYFLKPNAGAHLRLEAGATQERTL